MTTLDIDSNAPVKARHQTFIAAPPAAVWQRLTTIHHWPQWHPAISRVSVEAPLRRGVSFSWTSGGVRIRSRLEDVVPWKRLAWTGTAFGTQARHIWLLQEVAGGTQVITAESFDGWLVRLLPQRMQRMLERALVDWLQCLKRATEGSWNEAAA